MALADSCTALSVTRLRESRDLLALFASVRQRPYPWLLDSALQTPGCGRFSFAGSDPYLVVRAWGRHVELECLRAARPGLVPGRRVIEADAIEVARSLMPSLPDDGHALPFVGGAVGWWGYELAEQMDCVRLSARNDLGLPDLVLLFVDQLWAIDHQCDEHFAVALGFGADARTAQLRAQERSAKLLARAEGSGAVARARAQCAEASCRSVDRTLLSSEWPRELAAFFGEAEYAKAVEAVRDEIAAGRVYQANLTHRLELPAPDDPWTIYRVLRSLSPAPFAAYLELPELCVLSSSPERFLRLDGERRAESRPIKGTRPRGSSQREDAELRRALAGSEKDRAENLMIVDLVRNDFGRVCETGSIEVPSLRAIEDYSTVFQMVSTITGRLARGRDGFDLLRACFPPGSMTGAPKLAAMQLIDHLEPVRRGIYSGALGYLDLRGGLDLSVVIRTLVVKDGVAYLNVGGGIVNDSDPVAEYRETLDKARALVAAVELARAHRGERLLPTDRGPQPQP